MSEQVRAAIYARYSSELQNERSCQDQIALCSTWAQRQGIQIVSIFKDEGISGASTINRLGLTQLIKEARLKGFNAVICEDLDRIARKQADLHRIRDDLVFRGINILTVADGKITAMHAGLKGLMSEMFLVDLANKTRRGLRARVTAGASAGGRSYGYDPVPGQPGELTINPSEAAIVVRIFTEYVAGQSPRAIVAGLNAERVASPRGGRWNSSTLNGSKSRANGILQNRLYVGELVWNRQHFIKDPMTGKRVSRQNPESEWLRASAPHLAIVPPELFAASVQRKSDRTFTKAPVPQKPRHLLSGLLKCGTCGASYTVLGRDRLGCSGHRERGDCDNNRTIERRHVEARVLDALQRQLGDPELIDQYVQTYYEERKALATTMRTNRGKTEKRLAEIELGIGRIVDKVVNGSASDALVARLAEMENEQKVLKSDLAYANEEKGTIALHPAAAVRYRQIIENLQAHLAVMETGAPADEVLSSARALIEKVVITTQESGKPVNLTVHGLLADLFIGPSGHPNVGGRWLRGQDLNL